MSVELGSFWLIKDSGCIAIVKSILGKSNGGLTVVYVITNSEGVASYRMSCEYELFTNIADKLIPKSELKDELNTEYVKGKTDGYNEGYQHGFTSAKEEITELDEVDSKRIYNDGYVKGHNDGWRGAVKAYSFGKPDNEVVDKLAKKYDDGFDDGYNTAIKEMKSDKLNSGVCGSNVPNKEAQEAVQEVLDKDSNEFTGIWISKQHNLDWKIEYYSDCGTHVWMKVLGTPDLTAYIVGDLFTISKERLKSDYTKLLEDDNIFNTNTEDEQLEKELELVEKYPHYYKDIRHLNIIDIYRFFDLFEVTDPCIQHSVKKLAVGGKRGSKDYEKDIKEAMDTLKRWEYMQEENKRGLDD